MNTWVVCLAIIERSGKLLLTQQAPGRWHPGKWAFPGGVLDPGRTLLEQTLREAKEETNLDVKLEGLVGVYKHEGGPVENGQQTIFFVFKAKAAKGKVKIPKDEISGFGWFTVEELGQWPISKFRIPKIPKMMEDYARGQLFPLEVISNTQLGK